MVRVQRCTEVQLPDDRCVLAFVEATVAEASRHGVHDRSAFEPHEDS